MCGRSKGFTLVEVLVVIALIGLLVTVLIPSFSRLLPRQERKTFIAQLNGLMFLAWQDALLTGTVHQVTFDLKNRRISVSVATGTTSDGKPDFTPLKRSYLRTTVAIPSSLKIVNFIIEGYDEMSRFGAGRETVETYFFVMPDGLTQAVTINLSDTKDKNAAGKPRACGLVLNPFTAQFAVYDNFQK